MSNPIAAVIPTIRNNRIVSLYKLNYEHTVKNYSNVYNSFRKELTVANKQNNPTKWEDIKKNYIEYFTLANNYEFYGVFLFIEGSVIPSNEKLYRKEGPKIMCEGVKSDTFILRSVRELEPPVTHILTNDDSDAYADMNYKNTSQTYQKIFDSFKKNFNQGKFIGGESFKKYFNTVNMTKDFYDIIVFILKLVPSCNYLEQKSFILKTLEQFRTTKGGNKSRQRRKTIGKKRKSRQRNTKRKTRKQ